MNNLFILSLALLLAGCTAWGFAPIPSPTLPAATVPSSPTAQPTVTARPAGATAHTERTTATPARCIVANTAGDVLNVRKAPSMTAPIMGGLLPGERVTIIRRAGAWLFVQTGKMTGYISSRFCE